MENFELLAKPWWVNLFILVPLIVFFAWKKTLQIKGNVLAAAGVFGAAFGFVESSVVVYLRGAIGLLSEGRTHLPSKMFSFAVYRQSHLLNELPQYLLTVELYREVATIIMIVCIAILSAQKIKEKMALFLWVFAFWDIFYYVGLKVSIGWPKMLSDQDVLFLLPVPWFAQVWYPILVSILFLLAVYFSRKEIH